MDSIASSREFIGIREYIEEISGIVLNEQNAHLLESKLQQLFSKSLFKNIEDLYFHLCIKKDIYTAQLIIESITTNETFWFRDQALWALFDEVFLPECIKKLSEGEGKSIKIWSAACSSGQEPYSVAMTIENFLSKNRISAFTLENFEILATDISIPVLDVAKLGRYDSVAMSRGLLESDKTKYFIQVEKNYEIIESIRKSVTFKQTNLIESSFGYNEFDIVLFRNVLIYFSEINKKEIYRKIAQSLKKDGKLCVGSSELIDNEAQTFRRMQYNNSVYFTKMKR